MKKLFTLFAAGLMAGNLMADVVGTPSVTTFGSLEDLNGMTITITGVTLTPNNDPDGVYLAAADWSAAYGVAEFTFENNVLTTISFEAFPGSSPLPKEETDMLLYINDDTFVDFDGIAIPIHYAPGSATAPELATLTAEVINNGSAVSVTSSDPELYWTYRFLPYYEERDSAEFVASIDPSIEQDNGLLEDMAWSIISSGAMIGSQNVYVPEWYEDGEELTFFAYGIANVGNGTVKRASNVVYISHFTYNPTATALQNITPEAKATKTVKIIKNGKLMILHNGKKFNIMGVEE